MIKHHLKWKLPKQDVVQATSSAKSTFYIARRIIQSNSDRTIKKLQINEQPQDYVKQTPATSRAYTTSHYRSNSTTPSNFKAQLSQNFEELAQGLLSERQQSTSIISTECITNRFQKPERVVSLYQITSQNTRKLSNLHQIDQVIENEKADNTSEFQSYRRIRSIKSDFNKVIKTESEIFDYVPCSQTKKYSTRKSIFLHISYQDYQQKSKVQIKKTNQISQKQSIFIQKVLKNIKDSQQEKSDSKQLVRKYSKIWNENFSQSQFSEQQKYSKSQSQFKLYFNTLVEKILNKFRLYQQIQDILSLIQNCQNEIIASIESMHDLRKLYLLNHELKPSINETIKDAQFRFLGEIQSFGMIEILGEVQDEVSDIFSFSSFSSSGVQEKKLQYFACAYKNYETQYQNSPILSQLDVQTKNKLLSVDYTDLDKQIYQSNVLEVIPQIFSQNEYINRFVAKKMYETYYDILQGAYSNVNQLPDIEHNNFYYVSQTEQTAAIDKKMIMQNLRKQTKDAKIQGRRSTLLMKTEFARIHTLLGRDDQLTAQMTLKVPQQYLSRRKSKSLQSFNLENQDDEIESQGLSDIGEINYKDFKVKPVKYKQQLRLQNLAMFDHAIKKEHSAMVIVEMMIAHNLVDELIDFLRQTPNFSLNQRNPEGKPLILLAAQSGNFGIVQYMINQNVHLNVKDLEGNTPLHFAVAHRHYEVADLLLQNGANPYVKNKNNQNPWNWNLQLLQSQ